MIGVVGGPDIIVEREQHDHVDAPCASSVAHRDELGRRLFELLGRSIDSLIRGCGLDGAHQHALRRIGGGAVDVPPYRLGRWCGFLCHAASFGKPAMAALLAGDAAAIALGEKEAPIVGYAQKDDRGQVIRHSLGQL